MDKRKFLTRYEVDAILKEAGKAGMPNGITA